MNKKGFTTIELLLTMLVVITIMASITSVTYTYRDRSKYEETISLISNYKNMVTKIINDDLLDSSNPAVKLEKVDSKNFKITKKNNSIVNLQIIDDINEKGLSYDNIKYIIPDSNNKVVNFEGTTMYPNDFPDRDNTGLYSLDIVFSHRNLEDKFKIHFVIETYKQ